ncbi:MAG: thiolase family protein [Syntrophales bacterium]
MNRVMVVSAARTPLGAFCGQLESLSEQQLAAAAMLETVRRAGVEPGQIDEVIVGIAKQTSKPSNGGRHAMLLARLPVKIPAYTVQRQSASGLQAAANGYWAIRCGDAGVVLAGGAESMSQIPFEIRNSRYALGCEIVDAIPAQEKGAQPVERYGLLTAACAADHFAQRFCFTQGELEAFAAASLRKAASAAERDVVRDEAFPVTVKKGKKEESIDRDELPKKASLLAPPGDGAAMCLLASPERAAELGLPVLAEIISVGVAAVDPRYAAMAAAKAGLQAIGRAGLTFPEMDLIELNEMSAAECLAIMKEWQAAGIEPDALTKRINPSGGALALGNPWGAAGAVLLTRAVHELRRRGGGTGMVVVTAEGGQGMAMVIRSRG